MIRKFFILAFVAFFFAKADAQIINGLDTLYGNEWINFDQSYFKLKVGQNGIYRLSAQALGSAGIPSQITGSQLQLWHNGEQVPIFTSNSGIFSPNDFIEFFGKKNTSELDRYLFRQPDSMMMNPNYSLVTDTAAYFLTWVNDTSNLRYEPIANDLTNLPPKENYYFASLLNNYTNIAQKLVIGQNISTSSYDQAEGYASNYANEKTYTLSPTNIYTNGPDAQLSLRFSGNAGHHQQVISLNDQTILTSEFDHFEVRQETVAVPIGQVTGNMNIKLKGMNANTDLHRVANILLKYPRLFEFENLPSYAFEIEAASAVKYLEINNFDAAGGQPVLYDLTNHWRMLGVLEGGLVKFALPASSASRSLILVNETNGALTANLQPVPFIDFGAMDHDYIILTGHKLMNDGSGLNRVQEYADYRASQAGGGFDPIVVEAEQLYDQFSWGIERHPFSVRNFGVFVKKHWSNPRYFFIIGKGREYTGARTAFDLITALEEGFYVPTYSFPGSDNMLLAGDDGFTPVIPIGRIAAITQEDIRIYLDKIKELEANKNLPQTLADRAWMKRVMHMGSGKDPAEQNDIKAYLKEFETSIENSKFGAEVKDFYKTSTDPIQVSVTQQLFDFINSGTSLITFFGHSAVNTFDFSIDNPDNFENKGKYPMILSLGCYSGNIHSSTISISERFCFLKDKGAIAFGASSGAGYAGPLSTFGGEFYKNIGEEMYGQGIGDAVQDAIKSIPTGQFAWDIMRQQFNLHGDPAIQLNPAPGPDFIVDAASVKFNPTQITTQMVDFELGFEVVNIGSFAKDSILVSIEHELPNGTKTTAKELLIPAPALRVLLNIKLPTLGNIAKGYNKFYITVDKSARVNELPSPVAEQNNELVTGNATGIGIYFLDNSVDAVYPTEFSILGNTGIELMASTADPLISERNYVFQIDTTALFNSPSLLTYKTSKPGGIIKWKPNINWGNDQVYYWRISPDSISSTQGYIWDNSSFIYLNGTESGWNQSHFYQWKRDVFKDMELKSHGNLKFIDNYKDVFIKNPVNTLAGGIELQINNNFEGRFWYNMDAGVYVMVFDSTTASSWLNVPPYPYGVPLNIGGFPVPAFTFETQTQAGRQQLIEFLRDVVPAKDYVVLHTVQANLDSDYKPQDWASDQPTLGTDLFQVLENQGANLIHNTLTTGAVPYIFAYQKDVGPLKEVLADSLTQVLTVNVGIPGYWDEGAVLSTPIGPASAWNKLIWQPELASNPETDTISVDLLAHNPTTMLDSVLVSNIQPGELDLTNVPANIFPYLRLRFNSKDSIFRTSPQLNFWRLLYEGEPDFAVNPNGYFQLLSDTLEQGQALRLQCLVENIADFPGDSLLIKYTVRDENNAENIVFTTEKKLAAHDSLQSNLTLDTKSLFGKYSLVMELNPEDDQPEQTHVNNVLNTSFYVTKDLRNPLLDVTIDGFHIMDGDLVSAKPQIRIALKDENQYLSLNDTGLFKLFIALPDTSIALQAIYFNNPNLTFYPAQNNSKNEAFIEYNPFFEKDGTYKLIVQSRDVAGNQSGRFDYKISFNIINKSSISKFLNYPNPFTTSTRFVYTMTGDVPPPRFKLQIMTISGRIVRELTEMDLGPLKIGTHQTEFAWDGTDEYGDALAKGVYIYRMTAQDANGKDWDNFDTKADKYFEKGIGKLVILR